MKEKASPMVTAGAIIAALALVGGLGFYFLGRSSTPIMITPMPDHVKQMTSSSRPPGAAGSSSSGGPSPASMGGVGRSSRPGYPGAVPGGAGSSSGGPPSSAPGGPGSSSSGPPQ